MAGTSTANQQLGPYLEDRLQDLVDGTEVTAALLTRLLISKLIDQEQKAAISKINSRDEKALELYSFLSNTKYTSDVPKIIIALDKTTNSFAAGIFKELFPESEKGDAKKTVPIQVQVAQGSTGEKEQKNAEIMEKLSAIYLSHYKNEKSKAVIRKLISILMTDQDFKDEKVLQFADSTKFGLSPTEILELKKRLKDGDYYMGIQNFLNAWIAKNGLEKPNLGVVVKALEEIQWIGAAEQIKRENWQAVMME